MQIWEGREWERKEIMEGGDGRKGLAHFDVIPFLLTQQFRILDYRSDCRHVILSCETVFAAPPHN